MPKKKVIRRYGWHPSKPDHRDFKFVCKVEQLPSKVDLRSGCPVVYDQKSLGSCTSNAIAAAVEFDQLKENKSWDFMPSRLFIYYNERALEGTISSDSGAELRDGIKTINSQGVCKETLLPYNINKFKNKPSTKCYNEAILHKSLQYQGIDNTQLNSLLSCLASGYPFVLGISVYESFESDAVAQTGIVPMPKKDEQMLGGHAVMACGFNMATKMFLVRNSWSATWGIGGYFWIPFAYLTNPNLASDFWVINTITSNKD